MKCPKCSNMDTKVIDSRSVEEGKSIRRRRSCEYCEHRFTTFEKVMVTDLMVIKKDGSKELYDRNKVKRALIIAFGKKNISMEKIESLIAWLEAIWSWKGKEIDSAVLWEDILYMLKHDDEVAYVRFASVFKEFGGKADFQKILW